MAANLPIAMNRTYALPGQSLRSTMRGPLVLAAALAVGPLAAQLNVAAVNTAYAINFDGTVSGVGLGAWNGTGFQPSPTSGRLDSDAWAVTGWSNGDLAFGGTQITTGTDYRRGSANAPVTTGGMYAFEDGAGGTLDGNTLGIQPGGGDWAPGTLVLRVQNTTGSTLSAFDIAYNAYYRNDQNRSSSFNLSVSNDGTNFTAIPSQDLLSPEAASGTAWVANARSVTVDQVVLNNGYLYVRWSGDDVSGTGNRDEFALDDISITGHAYTRVWLTSAASGADEDGGTTSIIASILNPHPVNATTVDLVFASGDAARFGNYTTQIITFPGGSLANQSVTITLSDNGACDGDAIAVFELQNVAGGISAGIGTPSAHTLTLEDDETGAAGSAQAFDGGPGDNWPITAGAGNQSAADGAGDTPANERILTGPLSWQVNNGNITLDLGAVSTLDWSGITLSARLSSTSVTGGNGADGPDSVAFYVNMDGVGFPADPDIRIAGNTNARWGYSTGTGVASTTAGTPVNYAPAGGGNRTTDGYSTINITIPDGTNSVALRVTARNNDGNEIWSIDNITLSGTQCMPTYYSRANGSEITATWSTSRTGLPAPGVVTFNENATMVVQNGHTVTSTTSASINVRDLSVETGGTLTLDGTSTVTIHGSAVTVDGTLNAADDAIAVESEDLTTIAGAAGTIALGDLTLDGAGALVDVNNLLIYGTLQLDNGDFDANGKNVVLASTATGTGRLGPVAPTASYTSFLRVERYIPAGVTDWRLLCSPVLNKTVNDWTDDFYTAGFPGSYYPNFYVNAELWPSVRMYDETEAGANSIDGLIGVSSTTEPLTPGRGFAAWSGATLTSTPAFTIDVRGLPVVATAPFSIPLNYTDNGAPGVDGLNLVGNPLPSPIDFTDITLSNVEDNYYIYDPGANANVGWDEVAQVGTGGCNGNIQSSQGFWLTATGDSPSATLDESAKVLEPIAGGVFSDVQDDRPMVRLFLRDQDTSFTDEALVHFIMGEPGMDARDMRKLVLDAAPSIISTVEGDEDLMINARGELATAVDIPVKVQVAVSGEYTIAFGSTSVVGGLRCLVLEDLLTGSTLAVSDDAEMTFTIDAAAPVEPARFVLHVGQAVSSIVADVACAGNADGSITVNGPGAGEWSWSLITPDQGTLTQGPLEGEAVFSGLSAGDYQLSVSGGTGCGTLTQDLHIGEPGPLGGYSGATVAASCADASNGGADLTVMGGTAPYTFAWSDGSSNEDLQDAEVGTYTVTITDGNGCQTQVIGIVVAADAGPVAAFETSSDPLPMEDVYFFNTGDQELAYTWNFGDGNTSTDVEPVHQFASPGMYTVTLTAVDGDCADTFSQELLVGSTGILVAGGGSLSAWTEGYEFVVQWRLDGIGGILAEVLDAAGRTLAQRTAQGGMGRITLSAQELPAGVYFLRVRAGDAFRTFKLPLGR